MGPARVLGGSPRAWCRIPGGALRFEGSPGGDWQLTGPCILAPGGPVDPRGSEWSLSVATPVGQIGPNESSYVCLTSDRVLGGGSPRVSQRQATVPGGSPRACHEKRPGGLPPRCPAIGGLFPDTWCRSVSRVPGGEACRGSILPWKGEPREVALSICRRALAWAGGPGGSGLPCNACPEPIGGEPPPPRSPAAPLVMEERGSVPLGKLSAFRFIVFMGKA